MTIQWSVLESMVSDGSLWKVKQIAFKAHCHQLNSTEKLTHQWQTLVKLANIGFQLWNSFPNLNFGCKLSVKGKQICEPFILHYININFLKHE